MIIITGGGTGGHLSIARSLAKELNKRGQEVAFIGSTSGQDMAWFKDSSEFKQSFFLPSKGVVNKSGIAKLASILNIIKLCLKAKNTLKNLKARAVISVGGYSAAPASFAAVICKIPLFIHEQNVSTGKLNSLLKPFAKGFYSSYDDKNPKNYPVQDEFFKLQRERRELKNILFLGGSQGAKFINDLAISLAKKLDEKGIKIIHQCGASNLKELQKKYEQMQINPELFEFRHDMPNVLASADLAITRAGASSVWELAANALPAIFIPYPHAAGNHQTLNAKFLNCCKIYEQTQELDVDEFLNMIYSTDLEKTSKELKSRISNNGAKEIVDEILNSL